jgi:hypothetical protein
MGILVTNIEIREIHFFGEPFCGSAGCALFLVPGIAQVAIGRSVVCVERRRTNPSSS